MKNYMAPMEGVTNWVYRNAYHDCFYPMDKYFTPFITAKPNKRLSSKEIKEVSPETNGSLPVIPQILTNNAEDFVKTAHIFRDEYGHREVNLNLGCPSGTVTAKGKGAGFLGEPEKLERFLDEIFEHTDMEISIKTRVGTDYEEDWDRLLEIYSRYPMKELIIHPRLLKDYYKGTPRYELFQKAQVSLKVPLGYNGDIFSVEAYQEMREKFPEADSFMYGRGVIARPYLLDAIKKDTWEGCGSSDSMESYKKKMRQFHDRLYHDYQGYLSGERNVLFRMKEVWSYMAPGFTNYTKYLKKIKKSQHFGDYEAAVMSLFGEQEITGA
ncbi:tRNA-dihydrouridine synthase family protein [Blautia sp. CLA-JM-H16]|uniref:tRNA-dihydrouridine synthase n=1 Tax=Blautia aquisgranensis TaxID=3133153 RepID=A0ABV1BJP2_9FIRM